MRLRRFNQNGLDLLWEFLASLKTEEPDPFPQSLLEDDATSEVVEPEVEVEERDFNTRFEAGEYLYETLSGIGIPDIEKDKGIWAWLALFYFEQLCPADADGKRKPGEHARWIPETISWRKYYRHLLVGLYRIYRAHRDNPQRAMLLLSNPLSKPGEFPEQLASRQELVTNKAIVEAANTLYMDGATGEAKRGARGKGQGSVRRLATVMNQFDLTWDLYSMEADQILDMLPTEFNRFR